MCVVCKYVYVCVCVLYVNMCMYVSVCAVKICQVPLGEKF